MVVEIRGIIEGFYGKPWNLNQREELLKRMKVWRLNTYIYAPKDDEKHRTRWREKYTQQEISIFKPIIDLCLQNNVRFVYAISPGLDVTYHSKQDENALNEKFAQLISLGVLDFAVLFDDIENKTLKQEDQPHFTSLGHAQSDFVNRVYSHLQQTLKEKCGRVFFCPTQYCARMANLNVSKSDYLIDLGKYLNVKIDIFWTGPEIISTFISEDSLNELTSVLKRKPTIWDNLHANDYDMRRLYLGSYDTESRPLALHNLVEGIVINPNCEYEANYMVFSTFSKWAAFSGDSKTQDQTKFTEISYDQSISEWLSSNFETLSHVKVSKEDLRLFCDWFHLPHKSGTTANDFYRLLQHLLSNSKDVKTDKWKKEFETCIITAQKIIRFYERCTELKDRNTCYALYRFAWEAKEEMLLVSEYLNWLSNDKKEEKEKYKSSNYFNKIYRGGMVAEIQKLIKMDENGQFYHNELQSTQQPASTPSFLLRSFETQDMDGVYNVGIKTGDSGKDGSPFFEDLKLIGHRYVGPYCTLEPRFAFVLEDDIGICGYVLGALDTNLFFEKYKKEWLPEMLKLYPSIPKLPEGKRDADIIQLFHNPTDAIFRPEAQEYLSHLHIDLLPRAQGRGLGTKMIKHLCRTLKQAGSKGVHLCASATNYSAHSFYRKMGFKTIYSDQEDHFMALKF